MLLFYLGYFGYKLRYVHRVWHFWLHFFLPAFHHTSLTGSTDIPGLLQFQLTQYKTFAFFTEGKIHGIIHLERRAEFFLGEMQAQWDVCGGRILLGDNTRCWAVMRGRSCSSSLEFGYPLDSLVYTCIVYNMYIDFRLVKNSTCAGHSTSGNVCTASCYFLKKWAEWSYYVLDNGQTWIPFSFNVIF